MRKEKHERSLPKFDTPGWLGAGIAFSALLFGLDLRMEIVNRHKPFLGSQLGNILGMLISLVLGIHCIDIMLYHKRNRSWGKMAGRASRDPDRTENRSVQSQR